MILHTFGASRPYGDPTLGDFLGAFCELWGPLGPFGRLLVWQSLVEGLLLAYPPHDLGVDPPTTLNSNLLILIWRHL